MQSVGFSVILSFQQALDKAYSRDKRNWRPHRISA